jgi:S-adenosylmethionine:tRNA ribosyltransferase-isomerase
MKDAQPTDYVLSEYDYHLPEKLIAQEPCEIRDASRLMVLSRTGKHIDVAKFYQLGEFLPANSLILANNSTVIPGRLHGRSSNGSVMEMLILTPLELLQRNTVRNETVSSVEAGVLLKPSKKFQPGSQLQFGDMEAEILEKESFGRCSVMLRWRDKELEEILQRSGEVPLPPYIKRKPGGLDKERYQTVYADVREKGSIAAPTAGLHFTDTMKESLLNAGHAWAEVTLSVGYGTFSPIRCQDVREHRIHPEYVKLHPETVEKIIKAQKDKQTIVAVGTTTMRTVEGVAANQNGIKPFAGWLDTYIYPGFPFKIVQGLITNFHLPRSSLMVLVSAFAGREKILAAYRRAVEERFRFFSYGDCMFIKP